MSFNRDYNYYKKVFSGQDMPFAYVDLDLFDENIHQLKERAGDKKIRIASKSVRVPVLIRRVLEADSAFQGIMSFFPMEAVFLSQHGFDDILLGYPVWNKNYVKALVDEIKSGKQITLMIDSMEHVDHLDELGKQYGCRIPVCLDIDMSSDYPGLHFGVWRSSIFGKEDAVKVAEKIRSTKNVWLEGIMGYEAQIAGLGEKMPGQFFMNQVVRFLKGRSIKEIAKRRAETVKAIKDLGMDLRLVNGGGTGSLESTIKEEAVTEVTVGSGFFSPTLFDYYEEFKHLPSAGYAVEVVRQPKKGIYTCFGGGYTASGKVGLDKQPKVYLPEGAKLTDNEGAGEVQTPVEYKGSELNLGDPVFLRHSKAGELCERFKSVLLVSEGNIVGEVDTYRGEGECFV